MVDAGGGARRAIKIFRERVGKATERLKRIGGLVKSNHKAIRLIKTGAEPAWRYEAYGATDGTLDQLRAATDKAAGVPGAQACPITACQLLLAG